MPSHNQGNIYLKYCDSVSFSFWGREKDNPDSSPLADNMLSQYGHTRAYITLRNVVKLEGSKIESCVHFLSKLLVEVTSLLEIPRRVEFISTSR